MGQRGFWDEQQRVAKLQERKPVLTRLTESIPWESFRPLLDKGYSQERKSNAGRKRIDPLILFKMLVLQQLFNLSDEEVEFQVNDRRSFEKFVGLGVMNDIPDATTVAFFRERLRKAGPVAAAVAASILGAAVRRPAAPTGSGSRPCSARAPAGLSRAAQARKPPPAGWSSRRCHSPAARRREPCAGSGTRPAPPPRRLRSRRSCRR